MSVACLHTGEEWATDDVLFYTILEALRCSKVFRLSLTSAETEITSVHEETRPEYAELMWCLSCICSQITFNVNSVTSPGCLLRWPSPETSGC